MHRGKLAPWQRPHDAAGLSRARSGASVGLHPGRPPRNQPLNRPEVAQAARHRGCANGTRAQPHRAERGRGDARRRVQAPHSPAARRRLGLPQGHHPKFIPQRPAPLPCAPRVSPACPKRRTPGRTPHAQGRRDRLRVRGQLPVPRHRRDGHRRRLPARGGPDLSLGQPKRCSPTMAWPSPRTPPRWDTMRHPVSALRRVRHRVPVDQAVRMRSNSPFCVGPVIFRMPTADRAAQSRV